MPDPIIPQSGNASSPSPIPPGQNPPGQNPPDPTPPNNGADPAKARAGSLYGDIGEPDPGQKGSTVWPDNWRDQFANGDAKAAEVFKRFQSPDALAKAYLAAQQRIRSGEYKRAAPTDPSDAKAMEAWREEQGIPKTPDEYDIVPAGIKPEELDDSTKKSVGAFRETFHKANLSGEQAKLITGDVIKLSEQIQAAEAQADARNMEATEDALRAEWGSDYRNNLAMNIANMEKQFGDDTDAILMARTPDGRRLSDIPQFNKAMNAWARGEGGDVMLGADESGKAGSIESQIEEIKTIMRTDMNKYIGEGHADRLTKLLEVQEKRGKLT